MVGLSSASCGVCDDALLRHNTQAGCVTLRDPKVPPRTPMGSLSLGAIVGEMMCWAAIHG